MEFAVIARYRVRTGEEARVANALRNMVAPTRAEPGNLDYQARSGPARGLIAGSPGGLVADGEALGFTTGLA
jgi:quinol monooxygenase YgiN